jgi:acetoacetyl-CoA synthetase
MHAAFTNTMPVTTISLPPAIPQIRLYQDWLRTQRGLSFASYRELWQ